MPLKNRYHPFPPGGYVFFQKQTNWKSSPGLDFDQTVAEIIKHRNANPRWATAWSVDPKEVADELDTYICVKIANDENYCIGGAPVRRPFPATRPPVARLDLGALVAGARTISTGIGVLVDWLGAGGKAVPHEHAEGRAAVCVVCPKNEPGDWMSFFTGPAAEKIRKQLAIKNDMALVTSLDARLNVCQACWCHMALKVHTPIKHILGRLKPEGRAKLDPKCWIPKEEHEQETNRPAEIAH